MDDGWEEIDAGDTVWRFDRDFLASNWTCIWGRGCLGILAEPAEDLQQGCCSVGAEIAGDDEARRVAGLAATLDPARFQFHAQARSLGVFSDDGTNTRLVDGACIFLNRPSFAGGAGCALHLGALDDGESPIDWKPSVCWQLPIRVDWAHADSRAEAAAVEEVGAMEVDAQHASRTGGPVEVATVRRWARRDWGDDGEPMAWCCTEGDRAYVGDRPVVESLGEELEAMVGTPVYVELRRRLLG